MKNSPNFIVEINGAKGEIFVSDNDKGRYMCVFVKTPATDFCDLYRAYGFMVWTSAATQKAVEYFPIKLREQTKLTEGLMRDMWVQIERQIALL